MLLPRLRPGDLAVLDHLDMDRATAQALVDAGVAAVVNAAPMISGRYPNLGPEVLAEAGVLLVDGIGADRAWPRSTTARRSGSTTATVYVDDEAGRRAAARSTPTPSAPRWPRPARGLATQLETFTHNSTEFLRREQDLLLHGRGVPAAGHPDRRPAGGRGRAAATTTPPSSPRSGPSCASSSRS